MNDVCPSSTAGFPTLGLPGQVFTAVQRRAAVMSQHAVAKNTYRMRLRCPEVARQIVPGQFFMLRAVEDSDPLLGRPFALLDIVRDERGEVHELDFGYIVVGKFTGLLATLAAGDELDLWGPLGNGFPRSDGGHLAIIAGGIGQTPFVAVIREALGLERYGTPPRTSKDPGEAIPGLPGAPRRITVCYGARSRDLLAGVDWFEELGVEVRVSTDDGSVGHCGYVTDLLADLLNSGDPPTRVYCCGPEPMMRAAAQLTMAVEAPCWLSLETPMACGIGACFSCVARIRQDDGTWDYRRVCVEGPVFPADRVVFEE
jgi:dihydroorotate dehydrogenase electron transfer subunit